MADNADQPIGEYSHSFDCDDFWLDGPGDTTVRPIPPERLERAKAERAKILAAQEAGTLPSPGNDVVDFWLDGPGDTTVRPIPPERLEQAKALRARIMAAEALAKQQAEKDADPADADR